ncbi:oligosaccharide flippase family protein [Candidatus Nitrospira salsa]
MAAFQDDRAYMQMNLLRGMRFAAYISFPLCTGMMIVDEDLVFVALGEK